MAKMTKANIYLSYLDKILAGEKDIGSVEDVEIQELLLLAKTMIAADLSLNSKAGEKLRKRLKDHISKKSKQSLQIQSRNDDELDEEALEHVAAGFLGQDKAQEEIALSYIKSKNREIER